MKRRRVYAELLPPAELAARPTIELLLRHGLEVIVALPPSRETAAMAAALERLATAGVPVGLWPLLRDEDGYWPSDVNAAAFEARVASSLAFAEAAGVRTIRTMLIDLEPPLDVSVAFMQGRGSSRARVALSLGAKALQLENRRRRHDARAAFTRVQRVLATRGIESVAAVIPPHVLDLFLGHRVIERYLGTTLLSCGWDVISPMLYTSLIADLFPVARDRGMRASRALLAASARVLGRAHHAKASVSLGLVGIGKLGTEGTFQDPEELREDVTAARAAGIDDLALFALDGVLASGRPEAWLDVFAT